MITLFSAPICPFAQRSRALLLTLEEPFEDRVIDLQNRDPELLRRSPTGKVPFFVEGDFCLYESDIINDYLAESRGWEPRYHEDPKLRAREKLAMKQWDSILMPRAFYGAMREPDSLDDALREKLRREIDALAATINDTGAEVLNLLGLHVAPFWARMSWLEDKVPGLSLFQENSALCAWLDRTLSLPGIVDTLPERAQVTESYSRFYVKQS